jgi:hypothetical protein
MATAITFYSYKGGVGRTLALANVASQLAQLGRRVAVVDLDLEAPGVPYKLRPTQPVGGGVVDLVHEFLATRKLGDILTHMRQVERLPDSIDGLPHGWIQILPAGQVDDPTYWERFAAINWREFFFGNGNSSSSTSAGLGLPFFAELKQQLAESTQADLILFDALTGITELGGVATALLADILVCMFVLNDESIDGARRVIRAVQSARRTSELPPVQVFPVLARLPMLDDHPSRKRLTETQLRRLEEDIVAEATRHLKIDDLEHIEPTLVLHSDPSLQLVERLHFATGPSRGSLSADVNEKLVPFDGEGAIRPQHHRLYFDYVRLFNQLIPANVIDEYLEVMVRERRAALFDDPDSAIESLRDLVRRFPLPRSYRAVLQVYRLQKQFDEDALSLARDLVKATNDVKDPLVQDIVRHAIPYFEESVNVGAEEFDLTLLDFAADIWRSQSPPQIDVGLSLSNLYAECEHYDAAAVVLEQIGRELMEHGGNSETRLSVIERLVAIGNGELALDLLKDKSIDETPVTFRLRMQAVLATRELRRAQELISAPDFHERAQRQSPQEWIEILRLGGRLEDALMHADAMLNQLVELLRNADDASPRVVQRFGLVRAIHDALGRTEEFRARMLDASKSPSMHRRIARMLEEPTAREPVVADDLAYRWPRAPWPRIAR